MFSKNHQEDDELRKALLVLLGQYFAPLAAVAAALAFCRYHFEWAAYGLSSTQVWTIVAICTGVAIALVKFFFFGPLPGAGSRRFAEKEKKGSTPNLLKWLREVTIL